MAYREINTDNPLLWTKPAAMTRVPHSELAMHCRAAGCPVLAFARTGQDYGFIVFDRDGETRYTHGLLSEILPFGSPAYQQATRQAIRPCPF